MKKSNNENWARPESERRERQNIRDMRSRDIGAAHRPPHAPAPRQGRRKKSVVGARLIMFLIIFAFLLILCAGAFALYFFSTPDKIGSDTRFTYGKTTVKVDEDTAYRDSVLFVSFSRIADMLSMSRTGDAQSARFVLASDTEIAAGSGKEEYVTFEKDSRRASVSGSEIRLSAPAFFEGDEVYVPADFVETYMSGITVTADADGKKVTVSRDATAETDGEGEFIPEDAHFLLSAAKIPDRIDITDAAYDPDRVVFTTDLSAYEQYMNPADDSAYLVLVNRENTVEPSFVPDNLYDVINTRNDRPTQQMVECAAKALEALFIEMKAAGYTDVTVTSAYRSYEYQGDLYNGYFAREKASNPDLTDEEAWEITDTYSAAPGTSEHQTGLCCDMHNLGEADVAFAEKEVYAWLKENAWKFGFIERFPENKTEITGYSFEPWHYRFVGRKAAAAIAGEGLCLEEYLSRNG